MVYHGSLKGVGNSHTAFARAVRDFMALMAISPQLEKSTAWLEYPGSSQR